MSEFDYAVVIIGSGFGGSVAATIFPNLVISRSELANSLNIYNGAATDKSLHFMFWIAMIGVPIVLTYTVSIYYVFGAAAFVFVPGYSTSRGQKVKEELHLSRELETK